MTQEPAERRESTLAARRASTLAAHLAPPPTAKPGFGLRLRLLWQRAWARLALAWPGWWRAARQILYGMTTHGWACELRQERGQIERLFVLVTFGDLLGLPILPPYYTLRLLPHVVPVVQQWKMCMLRERDLTDLAGLIDGIG